MAMDTTTTVEEIRRAVRESYGNRVKNYMGGTSNETEEKDTPPELQEEKQQQVKKAPTACCAKKNSQQEPTASSSCCSSSPGNKYGTNFARAAEKMGYNAAELTEIPDEANLGLGCGAPLSKAGLQQGMTVLDLGSGAGFDAFLAARVVGPTGRVVGVDMTPEMVQKARENLTKHKARKGSENLPIIEFHEGLIEELPLEDNLVDLVISNCVINLSPDKDAVFREAYRVLKPKTGKICVSDIVLTKPLPPKIRTSLAAYMGCIAGAMLVDDYVKAMQAAGFQDIDVTTKGAFDVLACDDPVVQSVKEFVDEGEDLASLAKTVVSATVVAYKK